MVDGFDDPRLGREGWNALLARGATDVVFLTWEFQRAWWEAFGGDLMLIAAERDGEIVALAPFVCDGRSICFIGEGQGDWLDFIGDLNDDQTVVALLQAARDLAPDSAEFELQNIPAWQPRLRQLEAAATRLGFEKTYTVCKPVTPVFEVAAFPEKTAAMAGRKAAREFRSLRRTGEVVVEHLRDGDEILPYLDAFFEQHVTRWAAIDGWSMFSEPEARAFMEGLTRLMAKTGWLHFSRLLWNDKPIAYDYNFHYGNRFYMWRGSFAIEVAAHSPGAVMTRHVVRAAMDAGAEVVDWGPGQSPYKLETATRTEEACWWGTRV